jgi:TPR repeat protein
MPVPEPSLPSQPRRISSRRKRRRQNIKIVLGLLAGAVLFVLVVVFFVIRPLAKRQTPVAQQTPVRSAQVRPGRAIPDSVIDQLKEKALLGDARAQNDLGVLHQLGKALSQDDVEAARWYRRAAERNSVLAQNNLGWMYENGRGLERDYAGALFWYKLAAQNGNVAAQHNLASLYERGLGLPANPMLATEWYERAIRQGDETARDGLARVSAERGGGKAVFDEKLAAQRAALATPGFLERLGLSKAAAR